MRTGRAGGAQRFAAPLARLAGRFRRRAKRRRCCTPRGNRHVPAALLFGRQPQRLGAKVTHRCDLRAARKRACVAAVEIDGLAKQRRLLGACASAMPVRRQPVGDILGSSPALAVVAAPRQLEQVVCFARGVRVLAQRRYRLRKPSLNRSSAGPRLATWVSGLGRAAVVVVRAGANGEVARGGDAGWWPDPEAAVAPPQTATASTISSCARCMGT